MIYRDLVSLGRLPIDIYKEPLKGFLTYLIPVGIMVTLPVKSLIGVSTAWGVFVAFLVGILSIFIALRFWTFALRKYTSASS
jgi:ABC-2 type transport system permease protein